jgi:hypothetical protein
LAGHIPFINAGHLPVYCQNSIAGITGPGNHNNINNNNSNIETPSDRYAASWRFGSTLYNNRYRVLGRIRDNHNLSLADYILFFVSNGSSIALNQYSIHGQNCAFGTVTTAFFYYF